jgi:hypothetical protein
MGDELEHQLEHAHRQRAGCQPGQLRLYRAGRCRRVKRICRPADRRYREAIRPRLPRARGTSRSP